MQDARQRSILAGMGISLWVPRLARTRTVAPASSGIWRDHTGLSQTVSSQVQVTAPVTPVAIVKPAALAHPVQTEANIQPAVQPALVPHPPANPPVVAGPSSTTALVPAVDSPVSTEAQQAQSLVRFSVQAVELKHWILLIDEQSLQHAAARQLWNNICAAFANPEPVRFNWPLADGMRWQHPQGAKAALNGFLFRMGMDKRIGLMGQLQDDIAPDRIERLPTLEELLEQPLKKRSLWSLLKQQ